MGSGFDKNRTVSDYASLLQALLPGFLGFYCYDRNGRKFYKWAADESFEFTLEYDEALKKVLADPERSAESGQVDLGHATAFIIPFLFEEKSRLGAFSVLVKTDEASTYRQTADLIAPVISNLQKELNLSFRLMVAYKKLNVLYAEENLLHDIEKLVHLHKASDDTLTQIVSLSLKLLQLDGIALFIPDKEIRIFSGEVPKPVELRLMLSDMIDAYRANPDNSTFNAEIGKANSNEARQLSMPILQDGSPVGILILTGWKSAFSMYRRYRIGRYVSAHIADVVSRDYDSLTGLMNWALFEKLFARIICRDGSGPASVDENVALCFNIDRLHVINENLGPEKGDETLVAFADVLREHLGNQYVTRISSDTFAALMAGTVIDQARAVAEEIRSAFGKMEFSNGAKKERASVSIGIGPVSSESASASAALAPAQVACKAAKDRGRGRVEVFQNNDKSIMQRMDDIQLVGDIRTAIESGRLRVFAQPIVPLNKSANIYYFEVLVRLLDLSGNHILPAEFFSSAERYQLMEELDRWVIGETLRQLASHKDGLNSVPMRVAINLSGQSLGSEQFLPFVQSQIKKYKVPPEFLCFEITETVAVANLQRAQNFMHTLKKLGCFFSLDDFGTGLSSFSYLKLFPVSTLKIDGSFISIRRRGNLRSRAGHGARNRCRMRAGREGPRTSARSRRDLRSGVYARRTRAAGSRPRTTRRFRCRRQDHRLRTFQIDWLVLVRMAHRRWRIAGRGSSTRPWS